ncbi:uncharacterized protein I303_107261 [Kwoniella dejecticola CBS 10117]|uniref:Uncharacterized protein n=1 Tax=Kwoniella dejecticola CBS 10117 TaxID=1296121 RepID=A0A1A5ZZ67_9TREE|nr:uncharacterized protein I303_06663 [Kwoniella dejecticola CBS 10117]OBR83104.1 hypothetical protein I303_06663 [Kwoniella dejecticola CBS 10117]
MSFIGAGELEHKVNQLQRQLDHKDHELNSIKNEQRKKDDDLNKARRAKEDAEYKLRDEAERAHQAEKSISSKTNEITQLKLKLSNLESSLGQANEKLKREEKDNERIQNALDEALNSGSDGASLQIRSLQSRIKQLEENLKSAEQEKESLRNQGQGSPNDPWASSEPLTRGERNRLMVLQNQVESLREENARLQSSGPSKSSSSSSDISGSSSPSRPKGKRRSMSVSGPAPSEMLELENQIMTLQEQLALRKKDLDKAVNEKLAAEITSKKKVQKLESDMDDIKEELDFYRRNQDAGSSGEVEKVKKAMKLENDNLRVQLSEKEEEITKRSQEIQELEKKSERATALELELENERNARVLLEQQQSSSTSNVDGASEGLQEAEEKIQSLQAELAKARSGSTTSKGDMELRQVKRELQKTIRDKEYLESLVKENDELLAEKDEEIQRMKTAIPVPGSPVLYAQPDGRLEELENQKIDLKNQIQEQQGKYEADIKAIELQLNKNPRELSRLEKAERELRDKWQAAQEDIQAIGAQRDESNAQLREASEKLSAKQAECTSLASQAETLRADLLQAQDMASTSKLQSDELRAKLSEAELSLKDKESVVNDLKAQRNELETALSSQTRDSADLTKMAEALTAAQNDLMQTQATLVAMEEQKSRLEEKVEVSNKKNEATLQQINDLTANLAAIEAQLGKSEQQVQILSDEKDEVLKSFRDQLDDLKADLSSLQIQLDVKIAELAVSTAAHEEVQTRFEEAVQSLNKVQDKLTALEEVQADQSTESESRVKDEELFQLKEDKARLAQELEGTKVEHEKEMAASNFKNEQDLTETQHRIKALQEQVESLQTALSASQNTASRSEIASDSETLHRMEQKISQLRTERDELRHNLSFVQNERHFAIRAATSDKESALKDVRKTKEELKQSNAAYEKLQSEWRSLNERFETQEEDNAESRQLSKRISGLETDLADQNLKVKSLELVLQNKMKTLSSLQGQLQSAESRAEGLQKELLEMVHHVGQTTKLSDPPRPPSAFSEHNDSPTEMVPPLNSNNTGERTRRTSLGHMRSRSNVSVSAHTMQNLNVERQLQAKIGRRDARIAELTHDLEKANMNLTLAKEAQEETLEEISELTEERDRLQAKIQQAEEEHEDPEVLRSLVLSLIMYRQSHQSSQARWGVAKDLLAKNREAASVLRTSVTESESKAAENAKRLQDMVEEKSTLEEQVNAVRAKQETSQADLKGAQQSMQALHTRIDEYEAAKMAAAEKEIAVSAIEAQVAEKEDRIRDLKAQNIDYTTRIETLNGAMAELRSSREEEIAKLNAEIELLKVSIEGSSEQAKNLEAEKAGLAEQVSAAERALEEGMSEVSHEKERLEARAQDLERRVSELEGQLNEKVDALEQAAKKSEEIQKDLELAQRKEEQVDEREAVIATLQRELTDLKHRAQQDSENAMRLEDELTALRDIIKTTAEEKSALSDQMETMRDTISAKERIQEINKKQLEEAVTELSEVKQAKIMVDSMITKVKDELERSQQDRHLVEGYLKEVEGRLDGLSAQLASAKQELIDAQHQLEISQKASAEHQKELDDLKNENSELKVRLDQALTQCEATPNSEIDRVDDELVNDLKERIEQLEASLTQKTEEVDEADDRTREAFKANAKLEKKLGKLQRQLETAQVEKNTALNKLATQPQPQPTLVSQPQAQAQARAQAPKQRIVSAPLPISNSTAQPQPQPQPQTQSQAQSQRTPLTSVNIFKPTTNTNSNTSSAENVNTDANAKIGHKRHREDEPIKPTAPEAILQAPPISMMKTKSISPGKPLTHHPRTSFTPQRGPQPQLDIGKQRPAFPLPPTRSAFQPQTQPR